MIYTLELEPRYQETDKMGIIYHANYITWFEIARSKLSDFLNYPVMKLEEAGIYFPVLEVCCKYKKPAVFGKNVRITVLVTKYTGVRFCYEYIIKDAATDEVLVTGTSQSGITNPELVPIALQKVAPEAHKIYKEYARECQEFLESNKAK